MLIHDLFSNNIRVLRVRTAVWRVRRAARGVCLCGLWRGAVLAGWLLARLRRPPVLPGLPRFPDSSYHAHTRTHTQRRVAVQHIETKAVHISGHRIPLAPIVCALSGYRRPTVRLYRLPDTMVHAAHAPVPSRPRIPRAAATVKPRTVPAARSVHQDTLLRCAATLNLARPAEPV